LLPTICDAPCAAAPHSYAAADAVYEACANGIVENRRGTKKKSLVNQGLGGIMRQKSASLRYTLAAPTTLGRCPGIVVPIKAGGELAGVWENRAMTEVLVRADGLDVNEVPDGYVIYQLAADRVHYLNNTAAIIFELCDGERDAGDITARVGQMFEIETADGEIEACIQSLLKEGLVLSRSK
jgi:coenzyme PQQ synthesis protein D (PqqD)